MPTKTKIKSKTKTTSNPKNLPRLNKQELPDEKSFDEKSSTRPPLSTVWIIILAFAILAAFAVVVWALLSGRSDQRIHGDNLDKVHNLQECWVSEDGVRVCPEEESTEPSGIPTEKSEAATEAKILETPE